MQIKQLIIITIYMIGVTGTQLVGSQELNPIDQAQQLIDQGKSEKAITLLRKLQYLMIQVNHNQTMKKVKYV